MHTIKKNKFIFLSIINRNQKNFDLSIKIHIYLIKKQYQNDDHNYQCIEKLFTKYNDIPQ